jgi:dolichol kinase
MMVAMLLPATYVDPTFAALALSLVLAVFLILDVLRASQLPPLSKPLAYFLAPYVDGRDLRGPVVVSHIFLLIGCAIPLWLSLAAMPRSGTGRWKGWDIYTRDVSMVSGVICVGMGDAAASLIGRRYGRHKWLWSGGKSLEGSMAFATAVTMALLLAKAWLRIGGWPSDIDDLWVVTFMKVGVAAGLASLTEAVLTGGNDNVVVPIVLWLCVNGLAI